MTEVVVEATAGDADVERVDGVATAQDRRRTEKAIAGLKPYAAYRDTIVPWLEQAPTHWKSRRTKTLLVQRSEKGFPDEPLLAATQTKGVVRKEEYEARTVLALRDLHLLKLVHTGDFVISLRSFQGGIEYSRERGIISPAYTVLYPFERKHHGYLARLFKSQSYIEHLSLFVTGIRQGQNIDYERLARSYLPLPPLAEQAAIVRFLDYADRRIRRYIRAKQKLIALLEEQKQVIIHQVVTGQIDVRTGRPYPAYKTSGVEWLGRVPEDWEVLRLGRLIALTVGFPFKSDEFTQSDSDMRLLRGVNIAPGRVRWEDVVRWAATDVSRFAEYRLQVGDIVLGMDRPVIGGGIRVAAVTQSDVPSLLLQRVARIHPKQGLLGQFALRLLGGRRFSDYLAPIFTGVSVPHLSPEQVEAFPLGLPSMAEQVRIVEYLRSGIDVLHAALARAHEEIALIGEYRTRLIADVVTGKLDVREAAAGLPEVDPLAAEDDPNDGTNPEAWSDSEQFGVTGQQAEP